MSPGEESPPVAGERRLRVIGLAVIAAVTCVLYGDAVFRGRVFYYRDIHQQWVVQVEAFVRSVAAGSWPLWNRYVSFGQPLLANANNEIYYPLTWANLVMVPWTYYRVFVLFHSVLSGAGMLLLARRMGLSPAASLAAAAGWIACGPFVSLANLWNHLAGAAWIPWAACAADVALGSRRLLPALGWGATLAAPVLAGSPETALMAGLASAVVGARRLSAATARRALAVTAVAGVFALALSAGQWIPSIVLVARSVRSQLPEALRTMWSFRPAGLAQVLVPAFLDPLPLDRGVRAYLFEGREPLFASLYLGLPASALVLAAALARRRLVTALLALAALAALLALGRHGPLYPLLATLPGVQSLRFPGKAMVFTAFCWWLSAGVGLDVLVGEARRRGPARVWLAALGALVAGAAVVTTVGATAYGPLLVAPDLTHRSMVTVLAPLSRSLLAAAAIAVLLLVVLSARRGLLARQRGPAIAALVVLDLALAHANLNFTADPELFRYRPPILGSLDVPAHARVYSYDYLAPGLGQLYVGHSGYPMKVRREDWPAPWAEAAALRSALVPSVVGAWAVESAYQMDAVGLYSPELNALTWFLRDEEGTPVERRLLRMGAVARVIALHRQTFEDLPLLAVVPSPLIEPTLVMAVPDALPRAYAVSGVRVADGRDAFRVLEEPGFDPARELILPQGRPRPADPSFSSSVRIEDLRADGVRLSADLGRPGFVVLVDTFDPGWKATVDGRAAPVLRANVAFRAVEVPAGRHRVELVYRPREVLVGFWVFAGALAFAAVVMAREVRGRPHA